MIGMTVFLKNGRKEYIEVTGNLDALRQEARKLLGENKWFFIPKKRYLEFERDGITTLIPVKAIESIDLEVVE